MLKVMKQLSGPTNVVVIPDKATAPQQPWPEQEEEEGATTERDLPVSQPALTQAQLDALREEVLQKAQEEAAGLLEAQRAAADKEREEILRKAHTQAQQLLQQAVEEGKLQGEEEKKEAVDGALRELNQLLAQLTQDYQEFIQSYEAALPKLALEIAEKVLCQRIEEDQAAMLPLVRQAIGSIKNTDWITVELSSQMAELIHRSKEEIGLGEPFHNKQVEVVGKDGRPPGSCMIETPTGLVDASISIQMEKLAEYFGKTQ